MASPRQFAKNVNSRADAVKVAANRVKQFAAVAALRAAVIATPVDTGRARGGWNVGIGIPGQSGTRLDPSGQSAIGSGSARINASQSDGAIYVSNTIEYIGPLENGSSQQSPSGMTRIAINAATAAARNAKIKI